MSSIGRYVLLLSLLLGLHSCRNKVELPDNWNLGIVPQVRGLEQVEGGMLLTSNRHISTNTDLADAVNDIHAFFDRNITTTSGRQVNIAIDLLPAHEFGPEGYELIVKADSILIKAGDQQGIHRGVASMEQLLLLNAHDGEYFLPFVTIRDWAEFEHRGLLLDCSRHFFEVEVVKKYIDLLALFKMNTLHWHLTEDQAWRIAIEKYPRLTEVGAYRRELDGSIYGGFYTKDQIREVVAYATSKGINIIPEIEMPGHAQAAIASYPWLSCMGDSIAVANDWGVFKDIYCAGSDSVFAFLEDVLLEVMELFPSEKIHIGGDEAPKVRWLACPKCQKRIAAEGLKNEAELQSYFIQRIEHFLNAHGRILIGWDEILEGGLAEGAIVQSWRGMEGGMEAVQHGHQAIMSPTSHAYLDYGLESIDLQKVYSFYPIPEGLSEAERSLIIGGECNMWTEHVPTEEVLDSKVFPRMIAMAEVLWSDPAARDFDDFTSRLQNIYPILDGMGVRYGAEAIPFRYKMILESGKSSIHLYPYAEDIELHYRYLCSSCDSIDMIYEDPIPVNTSGIVHIQAYRHGESYGEERRVSLNLHKGIDAEVGYETPVSNWYTAGGSKALVDGKLGTLNFRDGSWQGFWGTDMICTLELDSLTPVRSVGANFYQYNNSWIFIPKGMDVEVSADGMRWEAFGSVESDVDPKQRGKFIRNFQVEADEDREVRFIRLYVRNLGKVPDWHEAAGSDAWIFMDEIMIE